MSFFLIITGLMAGAAAAWKITRTVEESRYRPHIQALQSRLRVGEEQSREMQQQLSKLSQETVLLRQNLTEERNIKLQTIQQLHSSFRHSISWVSVACVSLGLIAGGATSWYTAMRYANADLATKTAELRVDLEISTSQVSILTQQLAAIQKKYDEMQQRWFEDRVAKEIAVAKLDLLIRSIAGGAGPAGFMVDSKKLRKNLSQKTPQQKTSSGIPLFQSGFRV
ncbi:MAG: hypothetical protein A2Z83_08040 [Omnitrophica bacterium GWA2_52_8]|nr:MAG: hypothetical protein A2Z83_08040 [Omnitrophica bacterium GWA2_52_8]